MEICKVWVEWQASHVDMLEWWEELVAIPNVEDYRKLAWKICASVKIPRVRCEALKVTNDYSTPPALKCVERKLFLLAPEPRLPCQDYHEKQPQKPWPTLKLYSIGLKELTHQVLVKCTIWQDVFRS